ncbi:hypothetical protein CFAM422_009386 [Trichoderma lentiforme]|uniref:Uncharacterized protein n=1 Tax=Trichoderma lentiforme TaxID=1567552 RepID=A0A9P4XA75_9HYPO|nr:hypothetical protein CFAM422_009386 [Trichoderma lentiforme]
MGGDPGLGKCRGIMRSSTTSFMLRLPPLNMGLAAVDGLQGQWLVGGNWIVSEVYLQQTLPVL